MAADVASATAGPACDLDELYAERVHLERGDIPVASCATHTMGPALDTYVAQRIPTELVERVVQGGGSIEVHGVYPDHVPGVMPGAVPVPTGPAFAASKVYNRIRPRYFTVAPAGERAGALVVAVPPGRDYVRHYASLVGHHLAVRGLDPGLLRAVVQYPTAEHRIAEWTGLADLVRPGDRVLMGYVQELVPLLTAGPAVLVEDKANPYYGAARLRFRGTDQAVCALGVRFSFWGCTSGRLAAACQAIGAREVVYAGKLGCLSTPADVYRRLFAPSSFLHLGKAAALLHGPGAPPNGLLTAFPELDTGVHVSVGTVLEEDIHQRAVADAFGAVTIDNEIAQMAHAVARSATPDRTSAFSALHFATDYLHRREEHATPDVFNLTNHRRSDALLRKRAMLAEMAGRLGRYFDRDLPVATTAPPRTTCDGNR